MSILRYGTLFTCDWCRKTAEGEPVRADATRNTMPVPAGWIDTQAMIRDMFGSTVSHLCAECREQRVDELIAFLLPKKGEAHGDGN